MYRIKISDVLQHGVPGTTITVMGWVRTKRGNKNVAFIALNDGSVINNLQIVFDLAR
ncbi:MAG: asparagine--tRNA ligase, partial [Bacteroidetes bacterium HGW-Bacteroidetes-22]